MWKNLKAIHDMFCMLTTTVIITRFFHFSSFVAVVWAPSNSLNASLSLFVVAYRLEGGVVQNSNVVMKHLFVVY